MLQFSCVNNYYLQINSDVVIGSLDGNGLSFVEDRYNMKMSLHSLDEPHPNTNYQLMNNN